MKNQLKRPPLIVCGALKEVPTTQPQPDKATPEIETKHVLGSGQWTVSQRFMDEHAALVAVAEAGHFCRQVLNANGGFTAAEKRQATQQMDKAEAQLAAVRQ
jgi:hypothetical protein